VYITYITILLCYDDNVISNDDACDDTSGQNIAQRIPFLARIELAVNKL
jgi:hypothetical protein